MFEEFIIASENVSRRFERALFDTLREDPVLWTCLTLTAFFADVLEAFF